MDCFQFHSALVIFYCSLVIKHCGGFILHNQLPLRPLIQIPHWTQHHSIKTSVAWWRHVETTSPELLALLQQSLKGKVDNAVTYTAGLLPVVFSTSFSFVFPPRILSKTHTSVKKQRSLSTTLHPPAAGQCSLNIAVSPALSCGPFLCTCQTPLIIHWSLMFLQVVGWVKKS